MFKSFDCAPHSSREMLLFSISVTAGSSCIWFGKKWRNCRLCESSSRWVVGHSYQCSPPSCKCKVKDSGTGPSRLCLLSRLSESICISHVYAFSTSALPDFVRQSLSALKCFQRVFTCPEVVYCPQWKKSRNKNISHWRHILQASSIIWIGS